MYKTTYGELLKEITSFQSTGVLYEWNPIGDGIGEALPASKVGFKADIMSLFCLYYFEIRHIAKCLPRKNKKLIFLHYKKKQKRLQLAVNRMV